jgi:hypothetical protein
MFFLSFPRRVAFWVAGPEEAKNLGGAKGLRLIQIRLATSSLEKICRLGKTNRLPANQPTAGGKGNMNSFAPAAPKSGSCGTEASGFAGTLAKNLMDCSTLFVRRLY